MIKKTSIYEDMKELHKMVAPLRYGVVNVRMRKVWKRMQESSDALAKSTSEAVVAITGIISAHNKFADSRNKGIEKL